jgi:hypothetical protein
MKKKKEIQPNKFETARLKKAREKAVAVQNPIEAEEQRDNMINDFKSGKRKPDIVIQGGWDSSLDPVLKGQSEDVTE